MSTLDIFAYAGQQVRTLVIDDEPWFVAGDVCRVLGISNSRMAAARLDGDDVSTTDVIDSMGRTQLANIVNESGLYELIFQSRKPEARDFKRWVTSTVLPEIRRTGSFRAGPVPVELSDEEIVLRALQVMDSKVKALTVRAESAEADLIEAAPKVELADRYLGSRPNGRLLREVAKLLDVQEKWLRAFLLEEGLIFLRHATCGQNIYDFKAEFRAHFEAREKVVDHNFGACSHYTLHVTPRGVDLIRKRMATRLAPPVALSVVGGAQ